MYARSFYIGMISSLVENVKVQFSYAWLWKPNRDPYQIYMEPFKSRNHRQEKGGGPYLEVPVTQASSVTLTLSGNKSQRKTYFNFLV